MRKSTTDKPIRMQQALAYTYKRVAVYRSWVVLPTAAVNMLQLKKGNELDFEIRDGGIFFCKKTSCSIYEKSTNKSIRVQQIKAYTYKNTDVYRSWLVMPTVAVNMLQLKKGDDLIWSIGKGGILYKKICK